MAPENPPRAWGDWRRLGRDWLTAPVVVLTGVLVLLALLINGPLAESPRLATELAGGRLLPVGNLGITWSDYLASWHPSNGGTASPASPALLVLALAGTVLAPIGGPPTVVALLLLGGAPLAGIMAYAATRGLPVSRSARAIAAGAYALLPAASVSAAQGRLDVVVAHILLPPLLAGLASAVGLTRSANWLRTACLSALGLAVLGAFAPVMLAVLIVLALVGFIGLRGGARRSIRRVACLAIVVLLPVACLLPWPVVLLRKPEILLQGLGAPLVENGAGPWLLALSPDGSPATWLGGTIVLAAVLAILISPGWHMLPGVVVVLAGGAAAVVLDTVATDPVSGGPSTTGWAGAPLVLVAAGLLWITLGAHRPSRPRLVLPSALLAVLMLATGTVLAGRGGPLRSQRSVSVAGSMLMVQPGPFPARIVSGQPRFGDADVVPTDSAVRWLRQTEDDLLSGSPERVRGAIAASAARGVGFLAVPPDSAVPDLAGDVAAETGRFVGAAKVVRVLLPSSEVELLGPDLARQARAGLRISPQAGPVPVDARLPHFAVRVSEGGAGRLLVLGAENEPGWSASIDGRPAPLASAWGSQVAVELPERASDVRVDYTEVPRTTQLGVQAAAILFALIGSLPRLRRKAHPAFEDPASGDPISGDPISGDPISEDPASEDPASGDSVSDESLSDESASSESGPRASTPEAGSSEQE